MQVIFLSYSNSHNNPLPGLQKEDEEVYNHLWPLVYQQHFLLHRDSFATLDKITSFLTSSIRQVSIFSFSGHAGRDRLIMNDQNVRSEGIAGLLGQCARYQLKIVILNGCSTDGQVEALLNVGVPVVIATSSSVGDDLAQKFAIHFFHALKEQISYGEAFELAINSIVAESSITIERGLSFRTLAEEEKPLWGIYYKEENKSVLEGKLPSYSTFPNPENFKPNLRLTEDLWHILEPFSAKIRLVKKMIEEGDALEEGDKHVAILNSLPRPIAEHLRKLMAPVESEKQGYDKIGEARIRQMATAFETIMEFLSFILLSQLWAALFSNKEITIKQDTKILIHNFLFGEQLSKSNLDYEPLLLELWEVLKENNVSLVVPELETLSNLFSRNKDFSDACFFFNLIRKKLIAENIRSVEYSSICMSGELYLINLLRELGFLAQYTLAAVKNIDVLRYPHLSNIQFSHAIVRLMRVFGKLQEDELVIGHYLYNKSVLLFKESSPESGKINELCLSPFIIDENAFDLKTDLSKLFFYEYYKSNSGNYNYKHINRPEDPILEVSADKYQLAKAQFDTFREMLLGANFTTA